MKTILVDAVYTFIIEGKGIYQPMYDLLETYPNKKIILTGANDEQMQQHGLHDMPYDVFTLKHDPEKTDPDYFTRMLAHFNFETSDVIYFEHNPKAVETAESLGITSYHYDEQKQDMNALKEFIDTNL